MAMRKGSKFSHLESRNKQMFTELLMSRTFNEKYNKSMKYLHNKNYITHQHKAA